MNHYVDKETIQSYWLNLKDRDRLVLSVGGIVVLLYVLYVLLYAPLTSAVEVRSQIWLEKQETLAWMKRQVNAKPLSKQLKRNLLSLFSTELQHVSFSQFPYQLQQSGLDAVQLSFDEVPYVDFLAWLRKLNRQYEMSIIDLTVAKTAISGVVKVNVVVEKKEKGT